MLTARRGSALLELIVSMTLLAIIGTAAATAIRIQAAVRLRIGARVAAMMQSREALAPLAADLAFVSAAAGDLPPSGATDSTLDLRATVATGTVCALSPSDSSVAWIDPGGSRGAGRPLAGDTAWFYVPPRWISAAIDDVAGGAAPPGCAGRETAPYFVASFDGVPQEVIPGSPIRVTRRQRFSFYRAAGGTYLGLREWSYAAGALTTVQPVAGPFDRGGTGFTYYTDQGATIASPVAEPTRIAAIGIRMAGVPVQGVPGSVPTRDTVIVSLRNR